MLSSVWDIIFKHSGFSWMTMKMFCTSLVCLKYIITTSYKKYAPYFYPGMDVFSPHSSKIRTERMLICSDCIL